MFRGGGPVHSSDNGAFSSFITIVAAIQTTHTHCPTDRPTARLIDTRIRTTADSFAIADRHSIRKVLGPCLAEIAEPDSAASHSKSRARTSVRPSSVPIDAYLALQLHCE